MDPSEVARWIGRNLPGVVVKRSWGEGAWFHNPGGLFANGAYFLTIKRQDGPKDRALRLDRTGVWRMNFGLPVEDFEARFGPLPARPPKGGVCEGPWVYDDAQDLRTSHTVYGWMGRAAVVKPSRRRFVKIEPLLRAAHRKARRTCEARVREAA